MSDMNDTIDSMTKGGGGRGRDLMPPPLTQVLGDQKLQRERERSEARELYAKELPDMYYKTQFQLIRLGYCQIHKKETMRKISGVPRRKLVEGLGTI